MLEALFVLIYTVNYNTHINQYLKKQKQPEYEFGQYIEYNMRNIFGGKIIHQSGGEAIPRNL